MEHPDPKKLIRNLVIELVVYGILLVAYFFAVLRLLGGFLEDLFQNNIVLYAFLGLFLILTQGVVLEWLTSFFVRLLELERLE
ncbi:MAG: hypothetical protein PVG14_20070 [Anaerolineales bacterium]|jgi:hypothetical protein